MALANAASGWQARTRLELARGHWSLGEHAEALRCLERLADQDPQAEGLAALIEELRSEPDPSIPRATRDALAALERRVRRARPIAPPAGSPLATGTLASLLAEQGHATEALSVAEDVLRARPGDERALAVRERVRGQDTRRAIERLEGWLARIQRFRRGEAQA